MSFMVIIDVLFRWLHVIAACLAIGGAFFLRVVLPIGIGPLEAEGREAVFLRCRRAFKMVVHPCILVFLVTGAYNAWKNWPTYTLYPAVMHGMFGVHLLLGLAAIGISLWLLAGREPRRGHAQWMRINLTVLFVAVAVASSLKWVRDDTVKNLIPTGTARARPTPRGPSDGEPAPATTGPTTAPGQAFGGPSGTNVPTALEAGR